LKIECNLMQNFQNRTNGEVVIITGERNSGKTLFCLEFIEKMRTLDAAVKGIVSPGKYYDHEKTGILCKDIASGEERLLATFSPGWDPEKPEREWLFQPDIFKWGNKMLKKSTPTEILVIDELGFMEFENKKGWSHAFEIIPKGEYQIGLIVVRPIYVPLAKSLWNVKEIIRLNNLSSVNERVIRLIDNYHLDRR